MDERVDRVGALRDRIRAVLDAERQRIVAEIRSYPTPIPRCDQQFNHLIDKRERLFQELARLDATAGSSVAAQDRAAGLAAFIDACACLDADSKLRFKAALSEAFGKPVPPPSTAPVAAKTPRGMLDRRTAHE
jgi:hypothetical protein